MILYLLKSTLCLMVLFGVYRLLLLHTATFQFNRFFLLFAVCFSLTIPLIEIDTWKSEISDGAPVISAITGVEQQFVVFENHEMHFPNQEASMNNPMSMIAMLSLSIYSLVLLMLILQYILNITKLLQRNRNAKVVYQEGIKLYLLDEHMAPHSFLNRIFIGKADYQKGISPNLLIHELAHVQQRHSYDILFIELVKIIFWFNPILRLYAKAIRVNHEYLADRTVLEHHQNIGDYQRQLIQYMSMFRSPAFASQLNYSVTKKRFKMMKKKISKSTAVMGITALVPVLFLALMAFSPAIKKIEHSIETGVNKREISIGRNERVVRVVTSKEENWMRYIIAGKTYTLYNIQRTVMGSKEDAIGLISFNDSIAVVTYNDSKTVFKPFDELTEEEKEMLNTPPKKPKRDSPPTQKQLDDWLDSKKYGVWLDGKRISNEILKGYQPDDFSTVFIHAQDENTKKLAKYEYQISLRTNESFEKRWQEQLKAWGEQRKF